MRNPRKSSQQKKIITWKFTGYTIFRLLIFGRTLSWFSLIGMRSFLFAYVHSVIIQTHQFCYVLYN